MGKKLFLNVFYNIGIFICLITGYQYGFAANPPQYGYVAAAAVIIAIFIVLKVRLLKEVKNAQKNP
jgi:hypothetical protein